MNQIPDSLKHWHDSLVDYRQVRWSVHDTKQRRAIFGFKMDWDSDPGDQGLVQGYRVRWLPWYLIVVVVGWRLSIICTQQRVIRG